MGACRDTENADLDEVVHRRAFENGAVAVLLNPFDDQELLDAIERALKR